MICHPYGKNGRAVPEFPSDAPNHRALTIFIVTTHWQIPGDGSPSSPPLGPIFSCTFRDHIGQIKDWKPHFYRPQRSWGKVIFSQASVILFTGGLSGPGGLSGQGGCLVPGGAWSGAGSGPGGGCLVETTAGGTHPREMHSCLQLVSPSSKKY